MPAETVATVPGEPTDIYALVARGIHSCWLGAGGPMTGTHVFHAMAKPPSQGGQAEIAMYERDVAARDQRGAQAIRVSIESAVGGVRVGITPIKLPAGFSEPMTGDVSTWAKGGSGCQLRASFPQPEAAPVKKQPGKTGTKGKR